MGETPGPSPEVGQQVMFDEDAQSKQESRPERPRATRQRKRKREDSRGHNRRWREEDDSPRQNF